MAMIRVLDSGREISDGNMHAHCRDVLHVCPARRDDRWVVQSTNIRITPPFLGRALSHGGEVRDVTWCAFQFPFHYHINAKIVAAKASAIVDFFRPSRPAPLSSGCTKFEFSTTFKQERCASGNVLNVDPDGL